MGQIILASSSPRRIELMKRIGYEDVVIVNPNVLEHLDQGAPPEDSVAFWAKRKIECVAPSFTKDDIIIGADTIVYHVGKVFGKPKDEQEAFDMLNELSGNWHNVYTGLAAAKGDELIVEVEVTSVCMRKLEEKEIWDYIRTGEPMDKAGGYGIQEKGALLCERVDGDFYNVMGLPVCRLGGILKRLGVVLF